MLDYEDSTVTYTEVSSAFADLSDIGSPRVDGPPMMPEDPYAYVVAAFQAPPSPDYVPGLEEPDQLPPSPVYVPYVPKPVYPEFMPPEDEVLPAEEQPLPAAALPTINFSCYVPESDPEEDPKEDDEEDPEEDPVDYPADGGDDGDDEDESSNDDKDDDVDVDIEGDEEEEHPTPADSIAVALPTVDQALSAEETETFETDESAATPPPHLAYRIPSPPLLVSPPLPLAPPPLPVSPTYPLGYKAAMIRLRAEAPSTSHSPPPHIILSHTRAYTPPSGTPPLLPILAPTSSPSLLLPSINHGVDRPEVCLPTRKRLCFTFGPRKIMRDLERDVDYEITDTWEEMLVDMPGAPANDDTEDRCAHAHTALLMEIEAWGRSMNASDLARSDVMSLHTTVLGQQAMITELQAADRRRQATIIKLLATDRRRQAQFIEALKMLKRLQTHMTEFESQQGPSKGMAQPDAPEEASSSS
ncbi:hypothetical protein Tco_1479744 [Tanacetum coccineum]